MSPQAAAAPKRERTRSPSVRVTEDTERKLTRLGEVTARKVQEHGGIALKPTHSQLVEAMVDAALESENGAR